MKERLSRLYLNEGKDNYRKTEEITSELFEALGDKIKQAIIAGDFQQMSTYMAYYASFHQAINKGK